jgi:hypothetical protein
MAGGEVLGFKVKVLGWREVSNLAFKLWSKVRRSGFSPDIIVAVLKGGCLVGLLMADFYGVILETLRVEHYKSLGVKGRLRLAQPLKAKVRNRRVLLVDDVADSGETLRLAVRHLSRRGALQIRTGVLHVKPWTSFSPDYHAEETESWVVYPWEHGELVRTLNRKTAEKGEPLGRLLEDLRKLGINPGLAAEILGLSLFDEG